MMRQVALGAVVAFALTVLALSVFSPSSEPAPPPVVTVNSPPPAQTPVPADQPAATPSMRMAPPVKPLMLRPGNSIRPEMLQQRQLQAIPAPVVDAGAP